MQNPSLGHFIVVGVVVLVTTLAIHSNYRLASPRIVRTIEECANGNDSLCLQKEDLKAQRNMSDSAQDSVSYTFIGLIITGAIGLIGFWGTYFTLRHAKKHSEMELRAYIDTDIKILSGLEPLNKLVTRSPGATNPLKDLIYNVSIENSGLTPAHKFAADARYCVAEYPFPDEAAFEFGYTPEEMASRFRFDGTLGPRGKTNLPIKIHRRLDGKNISDLNSRNWGIYIFGRINYVDAFGERRITNFRYAHRIYEGTHLFGEDLDRAHRGNEAT